MTSSNEPIVLHVAEVPTMIDPTLVVAVDYILDRDVSEQYKQQPLAQDWARATKEREEHGEAIAELILATGQNPRKGTDPDAYQKLLEELADRALSCIYGLQHFTKDIGLTAEVLRKVQARHYDRLAKSPPVINVNRNIP